jgi:hypothetical protein
MLLDNTDSQTGRSSLFYEELIGSNVDSPLAIERSWLLQLVEQSLAQPNKRFTLLRGEPGVGKTALAASFVRQHPDVLRYFIRRDSSSVLSAGDARSLLFTIGQQLATLRPSLFEPKTCEIVVRQQIKNLRASGKAIGIQVDDLIASPFYRTAISVTQNVDDLSGDLQGMSIGRMVLEPRLLDTANLQYLALITPATVLQQTDPDAQIIIVVDALDELRYQHDPDSLLDWLETCQELPSNVRFVLTSRPDSLLDQFTYRQRQWLAPIDISDQSQAVQRDLRFYLQLFLATQDVKNVVAANGLNDLVERVIAKSDGNFQYLVTWCRGLKLAIESLDRKRIDNVLLVDEIPEGLDQLYAFFLRLLRSTVGNRNIRVVDPASGDGIYVSAWQTVYRPILSVLAVARAALSVIHIQRLCGNCVDLSLISDAVAELSQFLQADQGGYRLYHGSIQSFLTSFQTRGRHPSIYVDAFDWNRRIVLSYRGDALRWRDVNWMSVDDYGLRNLAHHLFEASLGQMRSADFKDHTLAKTLTGAQDNSHTAQDKTVFLKSRSGQDLVDFGLESLLEPDYRSAKAHRFGSDFAFVEDVNLLILLGRRSIPERIDRMAYGALVSAGVRTATAETPIHLLSSIALLDGASVSLSRIRVIPDPDARVKACLSVAAELGRKGERLDARSLLQQARKDASQLNGTSRWEQFRQTAKAFARFGFFDEAVGTAREIGNAEFYGHWAGHWQSAGIEMAAALAEIACVADADLTHSLDARALFDEALRTALAVPESENQSRAVVILARAAVRLGALDDLLHAATTIDEAYRDHTIRLIKRSGVANDGEDYSTKDKEDFATHFSHMIQDEPYSLDKLELDDVGHQSQEGAFDNNPLTEEQILRIRLELAALEARPKDFIQPASTVSLGLVRQGRKDEARQLASDVVRALAAIAEDDLRQALATLLDELATDHDPRTLEQHPAPYLSAALDLVLCISDRNKRFEGMKLLAAGEIVRAGHINEGSFAVLLRNALIDVASKSELAALEHCEAAALVSRLGDKPWAARVTKKLARARLKKPTRFGRDVEELCQMAETASYSIGQDAAKIALAASEARAAVKYADSEKQFSMGCAVTRALAITRQREEATKCSKKIIKDAEHVYWEDSTPGEIIGSLLRHVIFSLALLDRYEAAAKALEAIEYNPFALFALGGAVRDLMQAGELERAKQLALLTRQAKKLEWYERTRKNNPVGRTKRLISAEILLDAGEHQAALKLTKRALTATDGTMGKALTELSGANWDRLFRIVGAASAEGDETLTQASRNEWLNMLSKVHIEGFEEVCSHLGTGAGLFVDEAGNDAREQILTAALRYGQNWIVSAAV